MPYLQIINAYGTTQIDDTWRNPRLYTSFNGNTNTAIPQTYYAFGPNPPPAPPAQITGSYVVYTVSRAAVPNPTFVVYCTSAHAAISRVRTDGTNWIYTVYTDGPVGTGFTIHIYTAQASPASNVGFEAYRGDGTMLFDAAQKYIRADRNIILPSAGAMGFTNYNLSAGRYYGLLITKPHVAYVNDTFVYNSRTFYRRRTTIVGAQAYGGGGGHNVGSFTSMSEVQPTGAFPVIGLPAGGPFFPIDMTNY